ncbi:GGDEF domain-containing protein [Spirochaeta isovalerica]|uniref:diguanylate cyclase n=1 Tax=Spirochaeta isovalerica TaxID=150 RepID=A0A841R4Z3_9SPIO|nr:GGDEF domain-containing protein [Spirochaeta isovalerica]MBB6478886.1 diguanylate cyclase (GGDEF)-like protein [Spirochaeta isovalerica]
MRKTEKIELYQPANSNSYTIESLALTIPSIRLIYEHTFRHRRDGDIEIKRTNGYSRDPSLIKPPQCSEFFELKRFYDTFGARSKEIFRILQRKGFVRLEDNRVHVNPKTRMANPESFRLGFSVEEDRLILEKLNRVLWRRISMKRDENGWLDPMAESLFTYQGVTVIGEKEGIKNYKFRIGHTILSVEFFREPAIELLELVSLRILLIFQEQLQNFFAASAVQNYNTDVWMKAVNKRKIFFDILSTFLYHSWNPFDLEECIIVINSGKGLYSFSDGKIIYRFDYDGTETSIVEDSTALDREITDSNREFLQRDIDIGTNREKMETIYLSIYLKSRSYHNVDPRINRLSHHYIKMFIESAGKLIDVIIPILQREKTQDALRWKSFYDQSRISGLRMGENINAVLYESVRILKIIYGIEDVVFYSEDNSITEIITIFRQLEDKRKENFSYRTKPLNKNEIVEGNYVSCSLNDNIKERMVLYFKLPVIYKPVAGKYLSGTFIYRQLKEISDMLNLSDPGELLAIIARTTFSLNLTLTKRRAVEKLTRRFPEFPEETIDSIIGKLAQSFTDFFTLLDTISININSAVSTMRGSRDSLTGLYNRQSLNRRMETFFNEYEKSGPGFGVMFIDMDSFKIYNDTVNHSFGDKLIVRLAEHLLKGQRNMTFETVPARFGGDEFCFGINKIPPRQFEEKAFSIFADITLQPIEVVFHIGDFTESGCFEINLLSFLHRFIRPDIGGERGEITGYSEKENESPREHIVNIFLHYLDSGQGGGSDSVAILEEALLEEHLSENLKDKIIDSLNEKICDKIVNNSILKEIDSEFRQIIGLFLKLQLENYTTGAIRKEIIRIMGFDKLERTIYQRVSIGLSHSSEDRLRSVSSIFKQADARSYLAKQNGKNCVFGLNNKQVKRSFKEEISILIIDDEPEYIDILKRVLIEKYNWHHVYNFMNEENGEMSYKKLRNIDVIILDLQLYSDEDFNVILAYLKGVAENRELQIIVNSGYIEQKAHLLEKIKKTNGLKVIAVFSKDDEVYKKIDEVICDRFNIMSDHSH